MSALEGVMVVFVAGVIAVFILIMIGILKWLTFIARPNEALVFSGRTRTLADGSKVGYRVVQAGARKIRTPIIEKVDRLDMRLLPIDIVVQNAYSKGNIPLQIHSIANVKIHSNQRFMGNAVERFLGRDLREVQTVAQQTLEGAVREVIARLTPEQVNEDRLEFANELQKAAQDDLEKLGLQLDTLKIQSVQDETGYLDSIGRPQIAAALRDAENAENTAQQIITRANAESKRIAETSRAAAEKTIVEKRNSLRQIVAELEGQASAVEREAEAAAKTARAMAEQELQAIRSDLEEKRLKADVVIPAETNRDARAILAIGEAAPTAETGAAQVKVLEMLAEAWKEMGPQAKEIYVIQHLEELIGTVVAQLNAVDVKEVNVLDQGDGKGLANYASTYPHMVSEVLEAIAQSTGVNIPQILNGDSATNNNTITGGAR